MFLSQRFLGNAFLLFIISLSLRIIIFYSFIQFEQRYRQADSMDYHICALSIKHLHDMINPSTKDPIFWRTPGYPYFLSWFYDQKTARAPQFEQCIKNHKKAIFWQIVISAFMPLLIFLFTYIVMQSLLISWILSIIFIFHLGHILASCYLLTDALASLFFILFLLCFYTFFKPQRVSFRYFLIMCAALFLAIYTWMRPNGIFMIIAFSPLIFLSKLSWKKNLLCSFLFLIIFFTALSPWYIRNEKLTGYYFFCPMIGPYLQAFCASRIMHKILSKPLDECIKILCTKTYHEHIDQLAIAKTIGLKKIIPKEFICLQTALPWIQSHPFYFIYEWTREILKTTFDLYSFQLIAMHEKTHIYDPLQEFLYDKLYACLYKPTTPLWIKIIAWYELLFYALIWLGFLGTLWLFFYRLIKQKIFVSHLFIHFYIITIIISMSGGFGYARLRLCAEPLMILCSSTFWLFLYRKYKTKEQIAWIDYMPLGELNMPNNLKRHGI